MTTPPILTGMSVSDYADFERGNGSRISLIGGHYWRMAAPGFWKPLVIYSRLDETVAVPLHFRFGGYQLPVDDPGEGNSSINYLLFENPSEYRPDNLERKFRQDIARSLRAFEMRIIEDREEFTRKAYPVYLSFHARSNYSYRGDRRVMSVFAGWAANIYKSGKMSVIGAFRGESLCGIMVVANVEGVVRLISTFSDSTHLKSGVNEFLFHFAREMARATPGISSIFAGAESERAGVNEFKLNRGAVLVKRPARLHLNPVLRFGLMHFSRARYRRLLGATAS
jgi:hypothetical protein